MPRPYALLTDGQTSPVWIRIAGMLVALWALGFALSLSGLF
jgi:hypothetical protein